MHYENLEHLPQSILAFWHSHLLMTMYCRYPEPMAALISQSKDGELIARTIEWFGATAIRGSSSRGGSAAMREILRAARDGMNFAFTPDGPRGPARVASEGVVYAAQMTGLPIVPVAFAAKKKRLLRSWDRFIVPLPFTRAIFAYGEPMVVARGADVEQARLQLEREMNSLADRTEVNFEELWRTHL